MPAELLRAWAFFALYIVHTLAVPTANVSTTTYGTKPGLEVTVASEPHGRGTFRIIFSCTATFVFCIWTAVHPNIIGNTTRRYRLIYKVTLMILALLIPEGFILFAFGQWREARRILQAWREKHNTRKGFDDDLGMEGAFFVLMGGFVVDQYKVDQDIEGENNWIVARESEVLTATLTGKGFKKYLEQGFLHPENVCKKSILDKGKASNIAKLLAGTQALWLCLQCAARLATRLPLTLLEVHVVIQVLATLVIYSFWWHKPLDVNEPITIQLNHGENSQELEKLLARPHIRDEVRKTREHWKTPHDIITKTSPPNTIAVITRTYYEILASIDPPKADSVEGGVPPGRGRSSPIYMLAEGLLVTASGALHALAWNIHFPTPLETLLWRLSAVGMCLFPLCVVFTVTFTKHHEDLLGVVWRQHLYNKGALRNIPEVLGIIHDICMKHSKTDSKVSPFKYFAQLLLVIIELLFLLGYAICVVYITVEAYISLRNPPDGAFLTPTWTNYWPHL